MGFWASGRFRRVGCGVLREVPVPPRQQSRTLDHAVSLGAGTQGSGRSPELRGDEFSAVAEPRGERPARGGETACFPEGTGEAPQIEGFAKALGETAQIEQLAVIPR